MRARDESLSPLQSARPIIVGMARNCIDRRAGQWDCTAHAVSRDTLSGPGLGQLYLRVPCRGKEAEPTLRVIRVIPREAELDPYVFPVIAPRSIGDRLIR